ncbi:hypothetical protein [Pseudomonas abietaniphila]|uniref:hypothetical protein n=1 Tax=Pseudomonas abietaniphila TaxID=89065 RepID=UPI000781A5A6|nr:hypothetical protein [Pseudomonas abietaniphila]
MTTRPIARLTDARHPVTAFLAKYTSLIGEAEDDQGVHVSAGHATGYLQALHDTHQIDADTLERLRHLVEWTRQNRIHELDGLPVLPWPGSPNVKK